MLNKNEKWLERCVSKICLLIGGSKGLGSEIMAQYQRHEFQVVEFSRSGQGEHHVDMDLSHRETAIDAFDEVLARVVESQPSEVHLILNGATVQPVGPLNQSEPKDWWRSLDINLTLPISLAGVFQWRTQSLNARKVVGFVSSGAAQSAISGWSLYCSAKAGVEQFIRTMAVEQADQPFPIQCLNINPGVMDTDMQANIRASDESAMPDVEQFKHLHREGALQPPADVAEWLVATLMDSFSSGGTVGYAR